MQKHGRKAVVIKIHKADNSQPLVVKRGEIIEGKEKKTDWEGWLWCRTLHGIKGWIPKNYLQKYQNEPEHYSVLRDYNARELTVNIGQSLLILDEESGWAYVKTASQEEGWIPLQNLALQAENE
jgi:hypothetical protein